MVIQVSAIANSVQSLPTALWEQPQNPVDAARSVWGKKEITVEEYLQLVDLVSTVLGISHNQKDNVRDYVSCQINPRYVLELLSNILPKFSWLPSLQEFPSSGD